MVVPWPELPELEVSIGPCAMPAIAAVSATNGPHDQLETPKLATIGRVSGELGEFPGHGRGRGVRRGDRWWGCRSRGVPEELFADESFGAVASVGQVEPGAEEWCEALADGEGPGAGAAMWRCRFVVVASKRTT